MARAATTTDAFNAVAEPRRRKILDVLASGERPVNDLACLNGLPRPWVPKCLWVLREVEALYRLNARALKPIHARAGATSV